MLLHASCHCLDLPPGTFDVSAGHRLRLIFEGPCTSHQAVTNSEHGLQSPNFSNTRPGLNHLIMPVAALVLAWQPRAEKNLVEILPAPPCTEEVTQKVQTSMHLPLSGRCCLGTRRPFISCRMPATSPAMLKSACHMHQPFQFRAALACLLSILGTVRLRVVLASKPTSSPRKKPKRLSQLFLGHRTWRLQVFALISLQVFLGWLGVTHHDSKGFITWSTCPLKVLGVALLVGFETLLLPKFSPVCKCTRTRRGKSWSSGCKFL